MSSHSSYGSDIQRYFVHFATTYYNLSAEGQSEGIKMCSLIECYKIIKKTP